MGEPKVFGDSGKEYVKFLELMKRIFLNFDLKPPEGKSLAKAIDEYNYIELTLPEILHEGQESLR